MTGLRVMDFWSQLCLTWIAKGLGPKEKFLQGVLEPQASYITRALAASQQKLSLQNKFDNHGNIFESLFIDCNIKEHLTINSQSTLDFKEVRSRKEPSDNHKDRSKKLRNDTTRCKYYHPTHKLRKHHLLTLKAVRSRS
jgi:hypothetical protein